MSDVFDKAKRSAVMSKVHSKGNKSTELRLIEVFGERGIKGWRRNYPVKGHPDFVFPKRRIAMFVDGAFGTVMTAATLVRNKTRISGRRSGKEM